MKTLSTGLAVSLLLLSSAVAALAIEPGIAAYRTSRQAPAAARPNAEAKSDSVASEPDPDKIVNRFIDASQGVVDATTFEEATANERRIARMVECVNAIQKFERHLATKNNSAEMTRVRRQLESILKNRIRQHESSVRILLLKHDYEIAIKWLESVK